MANNNDITFEIKEHIGVLSSNENGWTKEVNIVAWNGAVPKLDIRDWDSSHERMTRGSTFTREQAEKLTKLLMKRFA